MSNIMKPFLGIKNYWLHTTNFMFLCFQVHSCDEDKYFELTVMGFGLIVGFVSTSNSRLVDGKLKKHPIDEKGIR